MTSGLQGAGLQLSLDPDRELERIHSLFAAHMNKLEALKGKLACFIEFKFDLKLPAKLTTEIIST